MGFMKTLRLFDWEIVQMSFIEKFSVNLKSFQLNYFFTFKEGEEK